MSKLVSENTLTFTRVNDKNCIGYSIYAISLIDGSSIKHKVGFIENPKAPNPIKDTITLVYSDDKESLREWDLPRDSIINSSSSVTLYVDGEKIDTNFYSVSPLYKKIYIDCPLNENSLIKVNVFLDRIKYIHNATEKCEYKIVPEFNRRLGQHSVIGI